MNETETGTFAEDDGLDHVNGYGHVTETGADRVNVTWEGIMIEDLIEALTEASDQGMVNLFYILYF